MTRDRTMELHLADHEYALVVILPASAWVPGVGEPVSILANCATEPSDPSDSSGWTPTTRRSLHLGSLLSTVLVTGAGGFVGSAVVRRLVRAAASSGTAARSSAWSHFCGREARLHGSRC